MEEVDKNLNEFFNVVNDDIPTMAFQQLFGMYEHIPDLVCGKC